jgi:hypothetical protein
LLRSKCFCCSLHLDNGSFPHMIATSEIAQPPFETSFLKISIIFKK